MKALRMTMMLLGALGALTLAGGEIGAPTTMSGRLEAAQTVAARFATASSAGYPALQRPTELQYWDPTRADNGYTFFGVGGTTYLLDMEGRVVHTWPIGTNPHLLSNGSVLDASNDDPSGFAGFKEVGWDGSTVWSYRDTRSTHHPHHDFTRIFNPKLGTATTLYIANKDLTYQQLVAAGADPARTPASGAQMDTIVEVDANGTIVWEWGFFDHVVQDYDATKPNHVGAGRTIADYPGRLNINLAGHNLKNDWLHCNSMDYNQTLDQIVINSVQGEFYVIDHGNTFVAGDPAASIALAATSAGDFLYRFGDPARYDQGTKPSILEDWTLSTSGHKQLGGAHDIQWIADGLPGAGHFLVFNNGQYLSEHTAQSYVMEIDPYLDASGIDTGHYVNPPDAGYTTTTPDAATDKTPRLISRQVVWSHASKSSLTLFSHIGCSAQRLPNGNTLICADTEGYILEVTPDGETVWDYIVPVTKSGAVLTIGDNLPMVNSIFRAYRYETSHPALAGRTLTPGATIAGRTTVSNPFAGATVYQALQRPTEVQYWDSTNAYDGYTFFAAQGAAYLVDMQGRVVNTWRTGVDPRLLASGNVLDWSTSSGAITGLQELDWAGSTVWQFLETRASYHPHGDFKRIYNPKLGGWTTLYLANRDVTSAECLAAGCDPANAPYDGAQVDTIVEVDASGTVVWEWSFWDHAIQSVDATKANHVGTGKTIADHPGRIDLNLPGRPLRSNWLDCNSLDFNQSLDQIVVNSRQGELYIIDHGSTFLAGNPAGSIALAATGAGDFLYRFGDPARYGQGNPPSVGTNWETATSGTKQIGGSSNAQWIASGLPGAGHLLVFNNNQYLYQRTPQSYVFEVDPYVNASGVDTGSYVNPPAAGYVTWSFDKDTHKASQQLSRQVVWKYCSLSNLTLFSHFGSSAQRLPNGNTLICATTEGYLVEVDASGNVVWEYINPVTSSGVATALGDRLPMTNAIPRALRYAASDAAFTGRDMTPGPLITELGSVVPSASFTVSPAAPIAGQLVQLTDTSSGAPTSWSWSFGDGGTSTQQSPTHTYTTAGTYTVTLTASNASGSDTATRTLTVTGSVPTQPVLVLPAVAHLRGLSATFTSRLEILNASDAAMTVTATYTPRTDIGGAAHTTTLTLQPGLLHTVDDPLATWFGFAAATKAVGSLSFTVTSGTAASLLVQSVITARNDDGSEYGQDLPATREAAALQTGATAYLASLVDASRTRINLAAMALDDGTVLTVRPVDPLGTPLAAARTLALGAGVSTQLNDLNGTAGFALGTQANYLLEVAVASGRAVVYASVLDGTSTVPGSSDPTTILPVTAGASTVTLLELGPIQGLDEFSGSAQIANLSATAAAVTADFHARGVPGVSASATLTIPAGDTLGYTDLVGELFGTSGVGTVVLRATNGTAIMATGREFSIRRDAGGEVSGTAGQLIPGMPDGERLEAGATYHLLGLRQRTVAAGVERSHLAVFNPGSQSATVTVTLLDGATGVPEGTTTLTVGAGELVRLNNVIPTIHAAQDGTTKRLTVTTDRPVFVKAFRVNAWGDPITVDALAAP